MRQLHKAIGDVNPLAICTDACKGLEKAVHTVFEHAEQRECFWHLMKNFVKRFGGDVHSHMYPAARAYRVEIWQRHMKEVIQACSDVLPWLETYHPLKWMRSGFNPAIKCDYITNNLAESFNNWIKDYKASKVGKGVGSLKPKLFQLTMIQGRGCW
jgi:transposase-like protein